MRWYKVIWIVGILLIALVPCAESATFRVELTEITQDTSPDANFLQAAYNFGTRFREIESVQLELLMPSGYGTAVSTGNSSHSSYLHIVIHGDDFDLKVFSDSGSSIQVIPPIRDPDQDPFLARYLWLDANHFTNIEFEALADVKNCPTGFCILPTDELPEIEYFWPSFLKTGQGLVTLQGIYFNSYHPLGGEGSNFSSESGLVKPPPVVLATLIIQATPIPEPGPFSLICFGFLLLAVKRYHCGGLRDGRRYERGDVPLAVVCADVLRGVP